MVTVACDRLIIAGVGDLCRLIRCAAAGLLRSKGAGCLEKSWRRLWCADSFASLCVAAAALHPGQTSGAVRVRFPSLSHGPHAAPPALWCNGVPISTASTRSRRRNSHSRSNEGCGRTCTCSSCEGFRRTASTDVSPGRGAQTGASRRSIHPPSDW